MKTIYAEEPTQSAVISPALSPEPSQNVTAVPSDTPGAAETPTVTVSPTQKLYTLSFSNPNNEWTYNGKTTIPPIQRAKGDKWGNLPIPQKTGYTFLYWYNSKTKGKNREELELPEDQWFYEIQAIAKLVAEGNKVRWVAEVVGEKYGYKERMVRLIVKLMDEDVI